MVDSPIPSLYICGVINFQNDLNKKERHMKKTIKIGLAVAMIVFATMVTVFGSELPVNVVATGEKSVNLYFGEIKGKVWISVYDEQGYILHSKTLKDIESYGIQYDLSDLPNGTYVLAMERDDQTKNVSLTIGNGIVSVNNHYVSKPALKVANQKVTVALNQTNEDT